MRAVMKYGAYVTSATKAGAQRYIGGSADIP